MATLASLVERHTPLLDETFGAGRYAIAERGPELCLIRSDEVEVTLVYDLRDRSVTSSLCPLGVPPDLQESMPVHLWLRFLNREDGSPSPGDLDELRVREALTLVRTVIDEALASPQRARDAMSFIRGYNVAYTDYYSGMWESGA